jgi:phenylalanyl-tRNA synthetase beta chain
MKVTWSWLSDWTPMPETPEALAAVLATRGLPVQSLERGASFDEGIVVGAVLEVAPHPNADRLRLCTVDVGGPNRLSVVCGAPNVAAGQRVAVAQIGSRLPDGTKLRRSKIRGVDSEGMICSERELGLSEESQGIWVLPGEPAVGAPLASVLGPSDAVLDVEITSNRTDCMCVRGLAREIASSRSVRLQAPAPVRAEGEGAIPDVEIEDPADCPRYMARVVRGVKIGTSPEWLRRRLEATGFRSINNVVDATNYVLREYGQPIHAFDAARVGGHAIRVRRARAGERLRLLDGTDVDLTSSHLVIADAAVPMALAGVMGGLSSGVTEATTDVVLESAQFDPALTRETARSLGIESEAAARFAQGVDPEAVAHALDAVARLLVETAGGTALRERVDRWPGKAEPATLRLSQERLVRLLGVEVDPATITRSLGSLEIAQAGAWDREGGASVGDFIVPSHRLDLEIEEDLIEEVARVVGYDAIPAKLHGAPLPEGSISHEETVATNIVDIACGFGFDECLSTALVGEIPPEARDGLADEEIWELRNPKSRDLKHLRVGLLPGLVAAAARNLDHGARGVRLVEIGKVFRAKPAPLGSERVEAGLLIAGTEDEWHRGTAETDRYLELKGALEGLFEALGIDSIQAEAYHGACWKRGTGAEFRASGELLGQFGEVATGLAVRLGLERPAWAALLDVASVAKTAPVTRQFRTIPRFPASKRDVAVVVRREVTHADVERCVRGAGGSLLDRVSLFDLFEGPAIGAGNKSMAYALEFRSPDRTLSDREVDAAVAAIVKALESQLGAVLRGARQAVSREVEA